MDQDSLYAIKEQTNLERGVFLQSALIREKEAVFPRATGIYFIKDSFLNYRLSDTPDVELQDGVLSINRDGYCRRYSGALCVRY